MYCSICCKWMHMDNFSAAVQNGNYGQRMNEPFCLTHTTGDVNN